MTDAVAFRIREAGLADIPALVNLINAAYRVEDFFIDGDRADAVEVTACLERGVILLAESPDGSLLGSVYTVIRDAATGYFGLLSVAPAAQKQGLGARLIDEAEEYCVARGCARMEITVVNLREELPPFYAKFGYAKSGETLPWDEETRSKLKREAHFIVMHRDLQPSPAGAARG